MIETKTTFTEVKKDYRGEAIWCNLKTEADGYIGATWVDEIIVKDTLWVLKFEEKIVGFIHRPAIATILRKEEG